MTLIHIPICLTKVVNEVKNEFNKQIIPPTPHIETTNGENNNIRKPMLILSYAGERKVAF